MANEMDTSMESEESFHRRSPLSPPPRLEEIKKNYEKASHSSEIMQFIVIVEKIIDGIDSYDFGTPTEKNEFSHKAYMFLDSARSKFATVRKEELQIELDCHDVLMKEWGYATEKELAQFTPVISKKQKNKLSSPTKDSSSAKK
ncbi:hypothetical protein TNCV_4940781 [Trichonephila clavipes]|nr:hypothetical protein TNCV_4940781 [Trichonephila clavipes]